MPTTPRWGGLRPEPYDSNARDADGDGIVQEGTAFERPAGTRLISFFGEAPNDGDITLDRDTDWRVVDESGQVVDYTPSYGAADETPLPKTLSESVGTIGSRTGTVGDQQETIGSRGTLENIVGTISKPATPLPPPRREREVAPEVTPAPVTISEAARARLPEGYVPGEIKPEMMMDFLTRVREKTISLESDHLNELSDLLRDAGYGYEDRMAIVARFRSEPEFRKIIDDSIEREKESLRQELASAFEAPLVINIPEFFIPALMETGRYKTQFETGKSGGIFNPGMRSAVEKTQMGVDPTIAPDMRPVYGSADQQVAGQGADIGELYGDTKLHLKDSVKERATLTIGDSLGDGQFPVAYRSDLPVDRVLAATSRWESNPVRRRAALRGAILDALNDENLPDEVRQYIQRTPEAFQKQDDFPPRPGAYYIESQIHGQVKLEDIDFVELPEGGDPENVERAKEALNRAGIRWRHEGMGSAPAAVENSFTTAAPVQAESSPPPVVPSVDRIGTVSRMPIETLTSDEFPELSVWYRDQGGIPDASADNTQTYTLPVYDIDGKKVSFGPKSLGRFDPTFSDSDVEVIPFNPYAITGLDAKSQQGEAFGKLFFEAVHGFGIESNNDAKSYGQVPALLYAASRGDNEARSELERLAAIGRQDIKDKRDAYAASALSFMGDRNAPFNWRDNSPRAMVTIGEDETGLPIRRPLEIDDLYLVHQTSYKPEFDEMGNVIIRPTGDFDPIDPETGERLLDAVTGKPVLAPERHSVHFALNHLVEGHMARATPTDGTYVIVVPLRDVLDANPGSLDNLYTVDTYLTPKPERGLVLPLKSGKVIETPSYAQLGYSEPEKPMDSWTPEEMAKYQEIVTTLGRESQALVNAALKDVGQKHNNSADYETNILPGGSHYSETGVDQRVTYLASEIVPQEYPEYEGGIQFGIHQGQPQQRLESVGLGYTGATERRAFITGFDYWRLSPNARLRLYNNDRFTTGDSKVTYVSWEDSL